MTPEALIGIERTKFDQIAWLRHKRSIGGKFRLNIELVVPINFRRRQRFGNECVDIGNVKARELNIEVRHLDKLIEQLS